MVKLFPLWVVMLVGLPSSAVATPRITSVRFVDARGHELTHVPLNSNRSVDELWLLIELKDVKKDQLSNVTAIFEVDDARTLEVFPPPGGGRFSHVCRLDFTVESHQIFPKETEADRGFEDWVRVLDASFDQKTGVLAMKLSVLSRGDCPLKAGESRQLKFGGVNLTPSSDDTWLNVKKAITLSAPAK